MRNPCATSPSHSTVYDPLAQTSRPFRVTDPSSSRKKNLGATQALHREALHDGAIGGSSWSPDSKTIAFISNISGRNNLWTVRQQAAGLRSSPLATTAVLAPAWSPDGQVDRLHLRLRRRRNVDVYMVSRRRAKSSI